MTPTQLTVLISVCAFDCRISATRIFISASRKTYHSECAQAMPFPTPGMLSNHSGSLHTRARQISLQHDRELTPQRTFLTCDSSRRTYRQGVSTSERRGGPDQWLQGPQQPA